MKKYSFFYLSVLISFLIFGCSSPLTRLLTTGNPSIPKSEIMPDGYYYVSISDATSGIFGVVKFYKNTSYGNIQGDFDDALKRNYNLEYPTSQMLVNGPYSKEDYANRERKNKIDNIKWNRSGNYREIIY